MTPRLFCLILGFAIGAALIGLIWIVWYVIRKEPDRLEHGQRTNRPEHWIMPENKILFVQQGDHYEKVEPQLARYGADQEPADWLKETEADKALMAWRNKYMRNADPEPVKRKQSKVSQARPLFFASSHGIYPLNNCCWQEKHADEMMKDELEKILERWNDGKDN